MSDLWTVISVLLVSVPFVLLALLNAKNNLKKEKRARQGFMPIIAALIGIVLMFLLNLIVNWLFYFLQNIDNWIADLGSWIGGLFGGKLEFIEDLLRNFANAIEKFLRNLNLPFWAAVIANSVIIIAYLILKRIIISFLSLICKEDKNFYRWFANLAYFKNQEDGKWYVKPNFTQGVTLAKTLYYITIIFGMIGIGASAYLYSLNLIPSLYFPVISVILVGEIYFFLDGNLYAGDGKGSLAGENDRSTKICDYTFMRSILRKSFSDKLLSENTTVNHSDLLSFRTNDEVVSALVDDSDAVIEAYGHFISKKVKDGLRLDQNYLDSGLSLLNGKSVLFNNPFYYDLIPYVSYAMNRAILRRKKVLIVLGRHAIEEDIIKWCQDGVASVTGIPFLWNIGILNNDEQDLDIGIVTRSSVHDLKVHESNAEFFSRVDFVMLIEPSRIISTAQIGLNSIIRHCRNGGNNPVFCSTDKNCDGLVDALSHVIMTSLEEVSATNKHLGTSSYMCWEADEEHLQHRMLPNLSRYLGVGTELSFSALKRQVSRTSWYGGDAFPVVDMHWIAKQYHYDLLTYASLPPQQALFDEIFKSSNNMWNAKIEDNHYISVEDENYNMYEVKRAFSTRASNQSFINVISTDYLLKDYMAANDGMFDADSKAIPYIVADYAHTVRNVIYRLLLRLSTSPLTVKDFIQEFNLINVVIEDDPVDVLWNQVCLVSNGVGVSNIDEAGNQILKITKGGKEYSFLSSVIRSETKYRYETGEMEKEYFIIDKTFIDVFLGDLLSAEYIAENETEENRYLGTELRGHVFQKYLPGQFFTFGGKYYEMLGQVLGGRVMVRRAADHITGRPQYRQVRTYHLENIADADTIGSVRDMGSYVVSRKFADISVQTPAYWQMNRYNDFSSAKKITINGVPVRDYNNKMFLRIDFSEEIAEKNSLDTIALLMNEVFRTLYAENQNMIVAVTPGAAEAPLTYSLDNEDISPNSIYIFEDSQLDIGLLISVERNLNRIFSIISDYLLWHTETLELSLNPPCHEKPDYTISEEERKAENEYRGIKGFFKKIGRGIKKVISKIGGFFGKLFGKKKKDKEPPSTEVPAVDYMMIYGKPHKLVNGKWVRCTQKEFDKKMKERHEALDQQKEEERAKAEAEKAEAAETADGEAAAEPTEATDSETAETAEPSDSEQEPTEEAPAKEKKKRSWWPFGKKNKKAKEETEEAPASETQEASEETADEAPSTEEDLSAEEVAKTDEAEEDSKPTSDEAEDSNNSDDNQTGEVLHLSIAPDKKLYDQLPSDAELLADLQPAESAEEDAPAEDASPATEEAADDIAAEEPAENGESSEEGELPAESAEEGAAEVDPAKLVVPPRKPYHERYYLLYGGENVPENINVAGALNTLQQLGFGQGSLSQARNGIFDSNIVEQSMQADSPAAHRCDYCGCEIFGTEYEIQADGRERCNRCSRTAVKTEEEFQKLYNTSLQNMCMFYGITINAPVKVEMVNAKTLHKKIGKSFVPTSGMDGRVLGVAIYNKKKKTYNLLLENGSPRLSAIMTIVHELTHIWQYLNWDEKKIIQLYGREKNLQIYEGMAKWAELQYAFLINELGTAKREEILTRLRDDEYGHGFIKYDDVYPLSYGTMLMGDTPFNHPDKPL